MSLDFFAADKAVKSGETELATSALTASPASAPASGPASGLASGLAANSRFDPRQLGNALRRLPLRRVEDLLFWLFALSIVLFPFGQAFRVVLPLVCLPVLLVLYIRDWQGRAIRHLPVWWLLALFFAAVAMELVLSEWGSSSWKAVRPNIFRGFLLPFIGMECVRNVRDLVRLTAVFALVAVLEGFNGVWQFATGADLLTGTPPHGYSGFVFEPGSFESLRMFRLTGSLSSYRVGNYMALVGIPACGLLLLWPIRRCLWRLVLTTCLLAPAIFLWLGAQARSGYMAAVGGLYLAWLMLTRPRPLFAVLPLLGIIALVLFGPSRVSLITALGDERLHIWELAWNCFLVHPWFGSGADTYYQASKALGTLVLPTGNEVPSHPHCIYLQWLVDGGIIGFSMMFFALFGLAAWAGWTIWRGLRNAEAAALRTRPNAPLLASLHPCESESRLFWGLGTFYWAGWCGFLINGLAAHGFYRTWWVAAAFSLLGIMLGLCVRGVTLRKEAAIQK